MVQSVCARTSIIILLLYTVSACRYCSLYIAPEATIPMEAEQSPEWTSSHYDRSAPDRSLMLQLASSITGHKLKVKIL